MDEPLKALVSLESILRTNDLRERPPRSPDYETENRALASLVRALADSPRTILQAVADMTLEALGAGSAGLSLLTKDGERFYWAAIAGMWSLHRGGGTPRNFGPCGDVLDRNVPLLFTHWERRYPYLSAATPLAEEGLLVPFHLEGKVVGTIWAISHDLHRKFDAEDLRLLESLGRFASAAYQAVESLDALDRGGAALRDANKQLAQSEERFRDFFEEAPSGYAIVGFDLRFIRANRAATRILGIGPKEVPGFDGKSLFPETPEGQSGLRKGLKSLEHGTDPSGLELELRRKDDNRPVWVRAWSRPQASERYTRTMFVDITDRVRMGKERARLEAQNEYLVEEIRTEHNFGNIIGSSSALRKLMKQVELVAPTEATVLITGETGTGKELVARAIHEQSRRSRRPLIKLNCSAVPEGLFESEFFGHVRGSFTGAIKDKPGRFELADGGTLFLDEIGEVPLAMQAKLLRVLQEQELERIGDTHTRKVNVRVIAATNRDLTKEIDQGRFRLDLFYRLRVFPIEVPPLREHREDIAPLAAHFIRQSVRRMNCPEPFITEAALAQLISYNWPGNVRQLQNVVERSLILWQEGPFTFDLPASRAIGTVSQDVTLTPPPLPFREQLKRQERDAIIHALKKARGKIAGPGGAAELLRISPSTLSSRISSLGINRNTLN
jgi:formate hydrogenlyase transcriptional activator